MLDLILINRLFKRTMKKFFVFKLGLVLMFFLSLLCIRKFIISFIFINYSEASKK
ncbi:hypothetical protein JOC73_001115 [Alkaliphilus hydrothermalis]|uniref:Uncharacterized protein n=1 Tax=Alkaliphilus hydrothermalis TaxID=1482730 RepID=A0ABS2NNT2_9FIRM|nr:hypothetical protein [Alkaliphilus hydrothermalis]